MRDRYDIVIVGGGHNGLVAAAYLGQAGKRVVVLERLGQVGGAAVSAEAFDGIEARLSRYSYLVSLLPASIIQDLRLRLALKRRRYSSYTPYPAAKGGLLIDHGDAEATAASLGPDAAAWNAFYEDTGRLALSMFPTLTEPLLTRSEARRALGDDRTWERLIEQPVGTAIADTFGGDAVRGVVLTDALIGTFAPVVDESLAANRCFLYHVIGNGTGDWDVPLGGMGAVTGGLLNAARGAGAEIITGAEVTSVTADGEVRYVRGEVEHTVRAGVVLANVAPRVLEGLLGEVPTFDEPEGAQVKINLMLRRLPRLRDSTVDPVAAFSGTFHVNEMWSQLDAAYSGATSGQVPEPMPCEIYCHSLTDPSILSPELRAAGAQTLTVFGLQVPHRLITAANDDSRRTELQAAVLASIDSVLAEPIDDLLLADALGRPAIETKTTLDIENSLRMPGGNIFHGPLSWPFAEDDSPMGTPAERWGVSTRHPRILLCGAGAQRGGAVSGIGGHNAAMAVLEAG